MKRVKVTPEDRNEYLFQHHRALWTAINHHRTHSDKSITFERRHFMKAIYLDESPKMATMKSTQCGVSEYLIIRAITKSAAGRGVFYILPNFPLLHRFVMNRFNKSMDYTQYYRDLSATVGDERYVESMSLKRFGKGSIAFVSSESPASFGEFPADEIIIDERDLCDQETLTMADGRTANSTDPRTINVGNPSVENYGIDYEYQNSDGKQWFARCSSCSKYIQPDFFMHVVERGEDEGEFIIRDPDWEPNGGNDIRPICHLCHKPFDRYADGQWVRQRDHAVSGYQINKVFSTYVSLAELVDRFDKALTNDTKMQAFCNYDLGKPFTAKGAKLSYDLLNGCVRDYAMARSQSDGRYLAGIDVGARIHVIIGQLLAEDLLRVTFFGTVGTEGELFDLLRTHRCDLGVIDAMPETRLSKKVCAKLKYFFRAYYQDVKVLKVDERHKIVAVERTASLDEVKERFMLQTVHLPAGAANTAPMVQQQGKDVSEFYRDLTSSTRVHDEKKDRYNWVHSEPDHFLHAMNYLNIAAKLVKVIRGRG